MATQKPTAMQTRGLKALAAEEDGRLFIQDFRNALAAKSKGFYLVMHRMLEAGLIERAGYHGSSMITITEDGRAAIAKASKGSV